MKYDYSGEQEERGRIGDNLMSQLEALADRQESLEAEIEDLEALLEAKKNDLRVIAEKELPLLLDNVTGSLRLSDGRTIEVNDKIRASVAGAKAAPACEWLDENGHGNIVKRQFVFNFNKDQEDLAQKFVEQIQEMKIPVAYDVKRTVHPQTLQSWVKEMMKEGVDIPKELFGVYHQKVAKVKRPD